MQPDFMTGQFMHKESIPIEISLKKVCYIIAYEFLEKNIFFSDN